MKIPFIYKIRAAMTIVTVLVFAALILWFCAGLNNTSAAAEEQKLMAVSQSVINGAVLCYSVEGFYPDSLDYLKQNYNLNYDTEKYLVHYNFISSDIRPTVMVVEKK